MNPKPLSQLVAPDWAEALAPVECWWWARTPTPPRATRWA